MNFLPQILNGLIEGGVGFFVDEGKKIIEKQENYYDIPKNKIESRLETESDIRLWLSKKKHNELLSEEVIYCISNKESISSKVDSKHLFFFVGPPYVLTHSTSIPKESKKDKIRNSLFLCIAILIVIIIVVTTLFILFKAFMFLLSLLD